MYNQTKDAQRVTDKLITMSQVATLLGVTTMTVSNWRREQGLPAIKLPIDRRYRKQSSYLYSKQDVLAWKQQPHENLSALQRKRRTKTK